MALTYLRGLAATGATGRPQGIVSVCSAHPMVLESAFREALTGEGPVLIEATCNQVNHHGGYTGMTPQAFRDFAARIARDCGLPKSRILFGGDHLGPNPWRHLPAEAAMAEARRMVADYAAAGYGKLHLDCSMGCAGEPVALGDALAAERAADLASVAETAAPTPPVYVVGTEVPPPGGALESLDSVTPTTPGAVHETYEAHRESFAKRGLQEAFGRVIALVVQPGVEFGNADLARYDPARAADLVATLDRLPGLVFEAHSTDYQSPQALAALVHDGFAILKVGPGLTFALREALYGLERIADELDGAGLPLRAALERAMLANDGYWRAHCHGSPQEQKVARHFGLSDRVRYYWPDPSVQQQVKALFHRLRAGVPMPLVSQYLGALVGDDLPTQPRDLVLAAITRVLRQWNAACDPG